MATVGSIALHRLLRSHLSAAVRGGARLVFSDVHQHSLFCTAIAEGTGRQIDQNRVENKADKWFTLPPFFPTVDGAALGKELSTGEDAGNDTAYGKTTVLKWIFRCCPDLPRNLVQKLFRLRQVRRETASIDEFSHGTQVQKSRLKRVKAEEPLSDGDRIYLPITVRDSPMKKQRCQCNADELKFIRSLVLYKDSAIIVINKPFGMPVQGGVGIKRSLDELAAACLTFDYQEPPRLVHRLDRDCSGLLVFARTQMSATVLHSVIREKTSGASAYGVEKGRRILKRKYWALVIGSPRRQKGLISAPLRKVVVDDGKSDRITVSDNGQVMSSQHAITEYRVIQSSPYGYTWLELCPLTGRKHQLRVHCAEVLGTPIVGDLRYGWQAHKNRKHLSLSESSDERNPKTFPFGLDLEDGSINSRQPYLHLHSKEMVLPNISELLNKLKVRLDYDLSGTKGLRFDASVPTHMQISWDVLNSRDRF